MTTKYTTNQPTTVEQLQTELNDRNLEIKHLNAVCKELQDELTKAKLRIAELEEAAEDAHFNMLEVFERME